MGKRKKRTVRWTETHYITAEVESNSKKDALEQVRSGIYRTDSLWASMPMRHDFEIVKEIKE